MVTLIAFGANNIDQYYRITHWPNPGDKAVVTPLDAQIGGMIGNAASVYAALGNTSISFDYLPSGSETDLILQSMKASHINTDYIEIDDTYELSKCLIFLHEGERIVYVISKTNQETTLTQSQLKLLSSSQYFYSNPIDFYRLTNRQHVIDAGCQIIFDVEYNAIQTVPDPLAFLQMASILFINQSAHEFLTSLDAMYQSTLPAPIIIVTLGDQGSILFHKNQEQHIPACPTTLVDTTGAGDTHHAAFLHAYSTYHDALYAARFASAAASLSITAMGPRSGQHTEQEVLAFAQQQQYQL